MKKSELIAMLEKSIEHLSTEYEHQIKVLEYNRIPGNPYTASLSTRVQVEKQILEKVKALTSLE